MRLPAFRSIQANLARHGWVLVRQSSLETMKELASTLGGRSVNSGHAILRPKSVMESRSGTFSALVGLGQQPFHTDAAHWAIPPRFLLLQHMDGETTTPTWILDIGSPFFLRLRCAMRRSSWLVVGRRLRFLTSGLADVGGEPCLRFDPICMKPMDTFARRCRSSLLRIDLLRKAIPVQWRKNATLVLDNWRVLHARGAVDSSSTRILCRAYVEGANA